MATADNLKIAQQLLATMQQITAQVERQTEAYHAQAQLADALCKAQECLGKIDAAKVKEVTDALREAQEKTKQFGTEIEDVAEEKVRKLEGVVGKLAEKVLALNVPAQFLQGFKSGLKLSNNFFKNILSMGGSALGLLIDIGKALLNLPGKLLDFFQGYASGGTDEYKQALEELRKEFGDLSIGTSAAIKNMTESTKDLGKSGLAISRVFGYGRTRLATIMRELIPFFKEMGPLGNRLAESVRGAEGEFALLRKATGLSGEAFKSFQLSVEEAGGDGIKAVRDMTKEIAQFTMVFGISSKEYGRDIEFMMKETQTFGIKSTKEMLKISTYVKKLGISVESLKKTVEKSFNFEDAAEQAAKLSEAFNIQIDAMTQFKETDPTKRLDRMREAFFKTGRSIEQMNAHERRHLATLTGVEEAELRTVFAQKNRALSGAALDAQMKKNRKSHITQEEAMQNLAKSIERLVRSGEPLKGSFFDVFFKGFERGVVRTREFRKVVRSLQQSLRVVRRAGIAVGRMFVKEFPGIKQILKALADMFNPRRFRALMKQVVEEFSKFFKALRTDPKAGVQEFMKNMKRIFFDFFTKGAPAGARFLDGLKDFYKAVGSIFVEGLRYALSALKGVLETVVRYIRDPASLSNLANEAGDGIVGLFKESFDYVKKELGPLFIEVAGLLWDLLRLAFSTLYTRYIEPNISTIVMAYFAPAIIGGLLRGGAALIAQGLVALIMRTTQASQAIAAGMSQTTRVTGTDGKITETTIQRQQETMKSMTRELFKMAGTLLVLIVAVGAAVLAIIGLAKVFEMSGVKKENFLIVGVMVGAIAALMFGMMKLGFFEAAQNVGNLPFSQVAKGVGMLAGTLAVIGLLALGVINLAHDSPEPEKVKAVAELMIVMTALFFAAAPLLAVAALVGAGAATGIGTVAATAGIAAMGVALIAIAGTAKLVVDKFAGVQEAQVRATALIMEKITDLYKVVATLMANVLNYARGDGIDKSRQVKDIIDKLTGIIHKVAEGAISILDKVKTLGNVSEMQAQANVISSILQGMAAIMTPLANFASAVATNSFNGIDANVFTQFGRAATAIIEKLSAAITNIMNEIKQLVSSVTNIEALKAAGSVITETMKSIAGLLGAIMQMFPSEGGSRVGSIMGAGAGGAAVGAMIGSVVPGLGTAIGAGIGFVVGAAIGWMSQKDEFSKRVEAIRGVIVTVAENISGLISGITRPLRELLSTEGITQESIKAAEVMTNIMSFIGQFIPAILKGAEGISNIKNMTPAKAKELIDKMKDMIVESMGSVKQAIEAVGTFVTNVLDKIGNVQSVKPVDQIKLMEHIGTIFGAIGNMIGSLAQHGSNMLYNVTKNGGSTADIADAIYNALHFIREVMTSIPSVITQLTGLIQPLITSLNTISVPKGFAAKVTALRSIFDFTSSITNVFTNFVRVVEDMRRMSGQTQSQNFNQDMSSLRDEIIILLGFFGGEGGTENGVTFQGLMPLLRQLIRNVGNLDFGRGGTQNVIEKIRAIKTVFESLANISSMTKTIQESIGTTSTGSVDVEKITRGLTSISTILTEVTSPVFQADSSSGTDLSFIPNILYDETLQRKVVQLNSLLRKSNFVGALTSLKDKLASIFESANRFPGLVQYDSTYATKARNALVMLYDVTGVISKQELEPGKTNPFFDLESPTNSLVKTSQLSTRLSSKNIGRNLTNLNLEFGAIFGGLSNIASGLGYVARPNLDNITANLDAYFGEGDSLLLRLDSFFGDDTIAVRIENISSMMRGRITTNIAAMVEAYNTFSRDLANFNRNISVTTQAAGAALGGRQTAEVRNAAVNATINVEVKMQVGDVVRALQYHTEHTPASQIRLKGATYEQAPTSHS